MTLSRSCHRWCWLGVKFVGAFIAGAALLAAGSVPVYRSWDVAPPFFLGALMFFALFNSATAARGIWDYANVHLRLGPLGARRRTNFVPISWVVFAAAYVAVTSGLTNWTLLLVGATAHIVIFALSFVVAKLCLPKLK